MKRRNSLANFCSTPLIAVPAHTRYCEFAGRSISCSAGPRPSEVFPFLCVCRSRPSSKRRPEGLFWFSECSTVWQCAAFGTQISSVRIRPFRFFHWTGCTQKCRIRSVHHLRSRNNGIPAEISGIIYPLPGANKFCSCFHYMYWWVLRKHIEFFWRRSTSGNFVYLQRRK